MNSDPAIDHINALLDTWHSMPHPAPLPRLWEIRRDMVVALGALTKRVKQGYGNKAMAYALRKFETAEAILSAMEVDKKAGGKARAMNQLTLQAEALNSVLKRKEAEIEAEAAWEEIIATIKMVDKALYALGQEISDGMKEKEYMNFLEGLRIKETSEHP
jgi:hypothetical protein